MGAEHEDGPWKALRKEKKYAKKLNRKTNPVMSWKVRPCGAFRYFRILQTGPNANGKKSHELNCSGIEFWGELIEMAELKTSRLANPDFKLVSVEEGLPLEPEPEPE